jgi:hypothetical protein
VPSLPASAHWSARLVRGEVEPKKAYEVTRYTDPPVNLANMRENGARALAAALLANEMAAGSGSRYRKSVSCGLMPNLPPPTRLKSADSFREK